MIDSGDISTRYIGGLHQLRAGQFDAAISAFRCVLTRDSDHSGARRNLIRALSAGRHDYSAVISETEIALREAPESAELHYWRGTALNAVARWPEAKEALLRAVSFNPGLAPAWLNLGNACMDMDNMRAAETYCRRALALDHGLVEAHISLGFILTSQGHVEQAIAALDEAIRLDPGNVHAHWNLATAALLSGDLRRGFSEYEWRKKHDSFRRDFINLPGPIWSGENPNGRIILVHAEQGFGDTVQFSRYLPLIAGRGGDPILACDPSLIPLLKSVGDTRIVSKFGALPPYDAWIDQMSLPRVFGSTLETIPSPAGYVTADAALVTAHRATLPPRGCIGLVWAGNPRHRNDRRRTPPEECFLPLTTRPDHEFVSLMPGSSIPGVAPSGRPLNNYAETAALIAALDLVITVDTSVAHVAGALGCPVWVLLPYAPDWRWLLGRDDSPWYHSVRLFRQKSPGDWPSVIGQVVDALAARTDLARR